MICWLPQILIFLLSYSEFFNLKAQGHH